MHLSLFYGGKAQLNEYPLKKEFPIVIPEILEIIFLYLNPYLLRKTIPLVCRQWYALAKSTIPPPAITWKVNQGGSAQELKEMVGHLDKAQELTINITRHSYYQIISEVNIEAIHNFHSCNNLPHTDQVELPACLALRSLTLEDTKIDAGHFAIVLKSCPNLHELLLMHIKGFHELSATRTNRYDSRTMRSVFQRSFYTTIAFSCPKLKRLHLSDRFQAYKEFVTPETLQELVDTFPSVTDWGFSSSMQVEMSYCEMKPFIQNVVTTLEIVGRAKYVKDTLHEYLCESPQLLHLIAPDTPFRTCLFDLEGILSREGNYIHQTLGYNKNLAFGIRLEPPYHRKIWACRNLKTLHLRFIYGRTFEFHSEASSRLLFGYIGKVCPRLHDLAIVCSGLSLQNSGGLCLLSRLPDLRKLKIVHNYRDTKLEPKHEEFIWIKKDTSPKLRKIILAWIKRLNQQDPGALIARMPFQSKSYARKFLDEHTSKSNKEHIIDGVDMSHLARMMDIAVCYQERLANNLPCFPNLEHITLDDSGTIDEIRKHRPELELVKKSSFLTS
ncbi:hypothetical protein BGZ76_008357 [Entomortierella beljakovae]|nr:hypothetical protein BGZ76_008357 [Entomortierella beljakovae]